MNTLPGPSGIQIGIFLGYAHAGWWGGVLAGLGFLLPGFAILLAWTLLYQHYGALPHMRQMFYGLNPAVVGIFAMSVYRLGRAAVHDGTHVLLMVAGALAIGLTPLGIVSRRTPGVSPPGKTHYPTKALSAGAQCHHR